jgi:pimeloyl-ACP methyl ester carboxylesterase
MNPEIVRFGAAERTLVGSLWLPQGDNVRVGFVLCRPFGSEAIRANMFYRSLASRLAAEGCATLCFDYHGTGESPGDSKDQAMAGWESDILVADAFLRERSGAARCHWFGLGLGASLACRAALATLASSQRPAHLVLWEPIEDGKAYSTSMCEKHRFEMERWFRSRWAVIQRDFGEPEPALPGVVLGCEIGAQLADDLKGLEGLPIASLLAAGVRITAGRAAGGPRWPESDRLRPVVIENPVDWMTSHAPDGEEYRGAAIVPNEAILAARETLLAPGPVLL